MGYGGYTGSRIGSFRYSTDNSTYTSIHSFNFTQSSDYTQTWSSVGAKRYWQLYISTYDGSNVVAINPIRFWRTLTTANMTLINSGMTAMAAPSTGFITVQAQPVDSITLNTDLTAEISRDGGTNWTAVTLTAGSLNGGFYTYEGNADLTGQPSGTSIKYRIKTLNLKQVRVSGVVLRWA